MAQVKGNRTKDGPWQLEALGLAQVERNPKNNRMRAAGK
jgi:hypothetical protein